MKNAVNMQKLPPRKIKALAESLVQWYRQHARDLPWRETRDPYAIWLSEIMLQQTRVDTVVGKYERFLERFPSLQSLAQAPLADVLAQWAGLGYYRRARNLHAAACLLVENHGGHLPRRAAELKLLPGFGSYVSGAVASIAFGEEVSAVDGNVQRVLSRLLALEGDPRKGEAAQAVGQLASALVKKAPPSQLNQALMELGATLCSPRSPQCSRCPWEGSCQALQTGDPQAFPHQPARRKAEDVASYVAICREGPRYLWRKRPEGGHNAGLWEFPSTEWHPGKAEPGRASAELGKMADRLDLRWKVGEPVASLRHTITHHRIEFLACSVEGGGETDENLRWMTPEEAMALGLTASCRKILAKLPSLL